MPAFASYRSPSVPSAGRPRSTRRRSCCGLLGTDEAIPCDCRERDHRGTREPASLSLKRWEFPVLQQQVGKGHGQIQGLEIASDGPLRRLKRTPFETKSTQAQVDWKEPTRPARLSNRSDEALLPAFRVRSNEYHYHSIRLADNVQPPCSHCYGTGTESGQKQKGDQMPRWRFPRTVFMTLPRRGENMVQNVPRMKEPYCVDQWISHWLRTPARPCENAVPGVGCANQTHRGLQNVV